MELTLERLKEVLDYDPETGLFVWKKTNIGPGVHNSCAGTLREDGYITIGVDGQRYRAHRLAWMYVRGKMPRRTIDHKNGKKSDNRFANLRDVSNRFNNHNQTRNVRASGIPVGIEERHGGKAIKWRVRIGHFGRKMNVGTFDTLEAAVAAYEEARTLLHPGYIPPA
jgi:hypothetical protein